jgi:hypothetical protein
MNSKTREQKQWNRRNYTDMDDSDKAEETRRVSSADMLHINKQQEAKGLRELTLNWIIGL